jgi:hypothetical protein
LNLALVTFSILVFLIVNIYIYNIKKIQYQEVIKVFAVNAESDSGLTFSKASLVKRYVRINLFCLLGYDIYKNDDVIFITI